MIHAHKRPRLRGYSITELLIVMAIIGVMIAFVLSAISAALKSVDKLRWSLGRKQPNIVIILVDDLGYADVGFQGCKDIPTPNIDSLATNGIRFTNGYVSACLCSPTRAGLLTGRYQQRFGHDNITPWRPNDPYYALDANQVTLANALGRLRYVTGHVGKWHLGSAEGVRPQDRGFRDHFGFMGGGHDNFQTTSNWQNENLSPILENGRIIKQAELTYFPDDCTNQAVAFIERAADRPFFLYLGYNAVHVPLQATDKYLKRVAHIPNMTRRYYGAMLTAVDDGVGAILTTLQKYNLEQDTLVFFLSDNGGPVTQGLPNGSNNDPLRGQKTTFWEGGMRVPFVLQWKGRLPKGETYDHPVIALDIFPTVMELAEGPRRQPRTLALDGVSLLPYLTGANPNPPHDQLFWRQQRTNGQTQWAVRSGGYKLVKPTTTTTVQLYDLKNDLSETKDLFAQRPDLVSELQLLYDSWNAKNEPPRW